MLLKNTDDHLQEMFLPGIGFAKIVPELIRNDQENVCSVTTAESALLSFTDAVVWLTGYG